jgi:peptide/nickel transport system substrate-binding protein
VSAHGSPPAAPLRSLVAVATLVVLIGAGADRPLRVGLPLQPATLDPMVSSQYIENYIEEAIFDGLTIIDDRGALRPDLATAVPTKGNGGISADGKTISYHLRRNVLWQDGVPFTARDVAFTFAKMRDPRVPFALASWYSIVKSVSTPDPYTVVVHLNAPSADATSELFVNGEYGMIVPEHVLRGTTDFQRDSFGGAPVGTGPYRVERWERGAVLELRANPGYFRGAPHIDRIRIRFVGDQNTLAVQKRTGELDFVANLPLSQIATLRASPTLVVRRVPTYYLDYIVVNTRLAPFDDVRVRQALSLAIDRGTLARDTFFGAATVADGMVPPWSRYAAAVPGAARPDAAAARALLDAAGWRTGADGVRRKDGVALAFPMTTVAGQAVLLNAAVELQAGWRAIGVDAELRPLQTTVLFGPDGVLRNGTFALAFVNYGELPWPDLTDNVSSTALPPRGANYARFTDRDVDRWLRESRAADSVEARRAIVARLEARLRERVPLIPVVWESFLYAWNADLRGVRPETVNSDFWNVADWRWRQ